MFLRLTPFDGPIRIVFVYRKDGSSDLGIRLRPEWGLSAQLTVTRGGRMLV